MYSKIGDQTLKTKKGERGSALLTVLFISTLLLAAGGALILVTGTASRTAIDATAEMQAYYSAEAGLQASLNVLRGNVAPNAAMLPGTKINFRNALTLTTSNLITDTSTTPRLSGWLNYNYTPTGATRPDRVALTAGYEPMTGLAYSVEVIDPDSIPIASGPPERLLLRVTGYGPKGAIKRLELVAKRSNFDYSPPCMLCARSSDGGTPMTFTIGESNAKVYTGHDASSTAILPTFGATSDADVTIEGSSDGKETVIDPKAAIIGTSSLPAWLQTAELARSFLYDPVTGQKALAIEQNRYFTSFDGMAGTVDNPMLTFVDGDCILDGGAGLLIVTGKLDMKGNPSFKGLILVLGEGVVERDGGGEGEILGAMVVARFASTGNGPFLAPSFTTNGGGTSSMTYDSDAVRQALNTAGPRVLGVHEY